MKKIEAKIIADSISPQGHRITSMLLTYPRFIHGEVMTHRMFSRNSASSRAIPFKKMMEMVEKDPFIPIAWQSKHTGMQGTYYLDGDSEQKLLINKWLEARDLAVQQAKLLDNSNVTKQLCNRLLEPFMWHTTLVTTTEISGFFELRCPKIYHAADGKYYRSLKDWNNVDKEIQWVGLTCMHPENKSQAEIHIQALAEAMWDAMNESTPKKLNYGEWHLPFSDKIDDGKLAQAVSPNQALIYTNNTLQDLRLKVCVSRAARLSYMNFDGEINYEKDIQLHDNLLKDSHLSPMEHCARAMSDEEFLEFVKGVRTTNTSISWKNNPSNGWCNNFRGWIPYRYLVENE